MGILSTILGSGDVISKGLGLIDSMHTSDTEMIEAKTKFFMDRDISAVQEIISGFKIDWIMLTITGFYFGGGAFEGVMNKKSEGK